MSGDWQPLGSVPPDALVNARLELHHAAGLVAALGTSFLDPRPDDGHPNLGWLEERRALAGREIPGLRTFRGALELVELRLLLLDEAGRPADAVDLTELTWDDACAWLDEAVTRYTGAARSSGLTAAPYELPDHPVAHGKPFSREPAAHYAELARGFGNSHAVLCGLADALPGASEVRCWPHHLDLATLVTVETDAAGQATKTLGIGFSPGDDNYPEPYWYVSPWPYPDAESLPPIPLGHWHTDGYRSAILTTTELLGNTSRDGQRAALDEFLGEAVTAARALHAD